MFLFATVFDEITFQSVLFKMESCSIAGNFA